MIRSAHVDTFARDNLPARGQWPEFLFKLPELNYPDRLNCVSAFVDDWVAAGEGARDCLISPTERLSYGDLAERVNRIANVLTRDLGVVPGNRVLLRGPNSPMMVAAYFAVIKAGAVGRPPWRSFGQNNFSRAGIQSPGLLSTATTTSRRGFSSMYPMRCDTPAQAWATRLSV